MGQHSMCTWKQISTDRNLTKHGPCAQNQICTGLARTVLLIRVGEVLLPKIIQNDTDRNFTSTDRVREVKIARVCCTDRVDDPCLSNAIAKICLKQHGPWLKSARGVFRQFNAHGSLARGVFGQTKSHGSLHGPCWTLTAGMEKVCQLSFERWSPTNQLQQLYFWGFVYINSSHNLKWSSRILKQINYLSS